MKADQVTLSGAPKAEKELILGLDANHARITAKIDEQCQSCEPELWVTFFFDGTNNNMEEDLRLDEFKHSNVVRLYRAHLETNGAHHLYNEYISGVGTQFKDDLTGKILDKGGDRGAGFATGGELRLQWALERLKKRIQDTLTRSPKHQIKQIHVALFGFSRGAALARAFALRLGGNVKTLGSEFCYWQQGGGEYPFQIYFMGLFDTVASVGTPTSLRKKTAQIADVGTLLSVIPGVGTLRDLGVFLAATADGHGAWAKNLGIPGTCLVKKCVHLISAHELRESFPLDLVAQNIRNEKIHTFENCEEIIYPGVHSDIGGGYHPGAQGRGDAGDDSLKLSQIPLHAMFRKAWEAGVPLRNPFSSPQSTPGNKAPKANVVAPPKPPSLPAGAAWGDKQMKDFALDPGMVDLFNHYLDSLKLDNQPTLQAWIVAHMDLYYRWRATILDQAPPRDDSRAPDEVKRFFLKGTPKLNREFKEDARQAWKDGSSFSSPYRRLLAKAWDVYRELNPDAPEVVADNPRQHPGKDGIQSCLGGGSTQSTTATLWGHLPVATDKSASHASPQDASLHAPDPEVCRFLMKLVHDSVADFWIKKPEMKTDETRLCNPRIFYVGGDDRAEVALLETQAEVGVSVG